MNLRVTLEVVASYEALQAAVTSELSITKVGLDVRFDILFAAEAFVAVIVLADPLVVSWVRAFDEVCYVIKGDVCFFDGSLNARLKVEVGDGHAAGREGEVAGGGLGAGFKLRGCKDWHRSGRKGWSWGTAG